MAIENVTLGWLVLGLTNSPLMLGVASAAKMLPFLFIAIPAGALADRVNRRIVLRFQLAAIAAISLLMAVLVSRAQIDVRHVLLLTILLGAVRATSMPIRQALIYDIVGRQDAFSGIAMVSLAMRVSGVIGAVFAGGAIAVVGVEGAYVAMGVSYLAGAATLFLVREKGQAAPLFHQSLWQNLKGGVRILRDNRALLGLVGVTAALESLAFSHHQLLPIFARDIFSVGAGGLGVMMAVRSAGGMLGAVFVGGLGASSGKGKLLLATFGLAGLGLVALALAPSFWLALIFLAGTNALISVSGILSQTLMQQVVTNEERGRAMGAWGLAVGVAPAGNLELGALALLFGVSRGLGVNGIALVVLALGFSTIAPVRRL